MAAIYWKVKGKVFRVDPGSLAFSVTLFTIFAFLSMGVLMLRRRPSVGGELGGARVPKVLTSLLFFGLWFLYILFSSLEAYCHIQGFWESNAGKSKDSTFRNKTSGLRQYCALCVTVTTVTTTENLKKAAMVNKMYVNLFITHHRTVPVSGIYCDSPDDLHLSELIIMLWQILIWESKWSVCNLKSLILLDTDLMSDSSNLDFPSINSLGQIRQDYRSYIYTVEQC